MGGQFNGVTPTIQGSGHPIQFIQTLSPIRWGIEAIMQLEFIANDGMSLATAPQSTMMCIDTGWSNPTTEHTRWDRIVHINCILLAMGIITRVVAYLFLVFTHRGEQQ
jgi:hypothetical protein